MENEEKQVTGQNPEISAEAVIGAADEGRTHTASEGAAYTAAEVEELIRREADRLTSGRERKLERELRAKMNEERINAVKEAEAAKEKELEELRRRLDESERARIMRERELECAKALGDAKLPLSLAQFAVDSDRDAMNEKIAVLRDAGYEAVRREIDLRIAFPAPDAGSRAPLGRDAIVRMSLAELQSAIGKN